MRGRSTIYTYEQHIVVRPALLSELCSTPVVQAVASSTSVKEACR